MKIAYVIDPEVIISNSSNGIRAQALSWATMLKERGHSVSFVNNWDDYDWSTFDIIHFFSGIESNVIPRMSEINKQICFSPICDPKPNKSMFFLNLKASVARLTKGMIFRGTYVTNQKYSSIKKVFVRSSFEKKFVWNSTNADISKFTLIPLSYSKEIECYNSLKKENFCLHISSIYQPRKNVINLIKAAKKFGFELYLVGNKGTEEQFKPIKECIGESTNIHVVGYVSEEEKIHLYQKAKVFALPSYWEGVGIVALDAAYLGCEIVITNIPGPKEYYNGKCQEVNPYDVDAIGNAIMKFLNNKISFQPTLQEYIKECNSPQYIGYLLEKEYLSMLD